MGLRLRELRVSGYRSLQHLTFPVGDLDVFVGANGAGKTNLYRALELARAAAANTIGADLAGEGFAEALWAGPRRRREPVQMTFSVALGESGRQGVTYRYEIAVGFPPKAPDSKAAAGAFEFEPDV